MEYLLLVGIIGLVIYITFNISINRNVRTYSEFISSTLCNNRLLRYTISNIMNIFLLISFIVMVSGAGAVFMQEFNLPSIIGTLLIVFLIFVTFFYNINGIIKVSSFLIPILIVFIIYLGLKESLFSFNFSFSFNYWSYSWIIKSILYASYNSIALVPIVISLRKFIVNKNHIKYIALFSTFFMIILSLIIFILLDKNINVISNAEIPILVIANKFGFIYKYFYTFVILIAIVTTAISDGYIFLENVSKNKKQYFIYSIFICLMAICFSNIGFTNLLNLLYPILGYLGLAQIIVLCISFK